MSTTEVVPPIFCINLKTSTRRRESMTRRFTNAGLLDRVTFLEAVTPDDFIVDVLTKDFEAWHKNSKQLACEAACFASHIKALKAFLSSGAAHGIVMEDDVMLHNDFQILYKNLFSRVPNDTEVVLLCYYISSWEGFQYYESNSDIIRINPKTTWGAQGYRVTRSFAERIIKELANPFRLMGPPETSEKILQQEGALLVKPPLVIEESVDSHIRPPEDLQRHRNYFKHFGYENYSHCEK